jgi:drug/metabolite transporter (DMT)-like permease
MESERTLPKPSQRRVIFFLVLTTMLWGGSFVFNKLGFRELPPVTFLFFRFSLATALMFLVCIGRLRRTDRTTVVKGVKVGLALLAANLSFVVGLDGTTVARAAFLNNLFVLFVPLLGFLLWRDRISRFLVGGILLAVSGLWMLAHGGVSGFSRGDLFSTLCAFCIAIHILAVSKLLKDEDVYLVTLFQLATVAVAGGILSLLFAPSIQAFGGVTWGSLIYCAVFPTILCFTIQNTYQRYTTPAQAGLVYTLDPVWSLVGGMLILGERLTAREWAGCGLIFAAVVVPVGISRIVERKTISRYRKG